MFGAGRDLPLGPRAAHSQVEAFLTERGRAIGASACDDMPQREMVAAVARDIEPAVNANWRAVRQRVRKHRMLVLNDEVSDPEGWETFDIHLTQVERWKAMGFDAFEAAIAQGDGYTPQSATDYCSQLRATAGRWKQAGLCSEEGLRWHRAGFGAKEATHWRSQGLDVKAARSQRDGYRIAGSAVESAPPEGRP